MSTYVKQMKKIPLLIEMNAIVNCYCPAAHSHPLSCVSWVKLGRHHTNMGILLASCIASLALNFPSGFVRSLVLKPQPSSDEAFSVIDIYVIVKYHSFCPILCWLSNQLAEAFLLFL